MEKEIALCPDPELYREILERVRGGCRPAERPEALFLCGQPGCGKTSLAESLRDKGKAYIGGDDFREYHPDRDYIRERFPDYFAEITQPFVSACVRLLLRDLSKARIPLIVEGTLRNPKVQVRTAEALLAEGYRADMVIPLASAECAWQRTLRRARDAEARGTCVRLVPLGKYNGTVLHLPSSLRQAEESGLFASIRLAGTNGRTDLLWHPGDAGPRPSDRLTEALDLTAWRQSAPRHKREYARAMQKVRERQGLVRTDRSAMIEEIPAMREEEKRPEEREETVYAADIGWER